MTPLRLSVIAIVVSVASVVFTGVQAMATAGMRRIEHARRLQERRPVLDAKVLGQAPVRRLRITLMSDEQLTAMDVTIASREQGVRFPRDPARLGRGGVLTAPFIGRNGTLFLMKPGQSAEQTVSVGDKHADLLMLQVRCRGKGRAVWDLLVDAQFDPDN
jgi:hypothetical protein